MQMKRTLMGPLLLLLTPSLATFPFSPVPIQPELQVLSIVLQVYLLLFDETMIRSGLACLNRLVMYASQRAFFVPTSSSMSFLCIVLSRAATTGTALTVSKQTVTLRSEASNSGSRSSMEQGLSSHAAAPRFPEIEPHPAQYCFCAKAFLEAGPILLSYHEAELCLFSWQVYEDKCATR